MLGLLQRDPEAFLQGHVSLPPAEIERLIAERDAAKRRKDYKAADDIRKDLLDKGIVLEDSPAGTKWRRR